MISQRNSEIPLYHKWFKDVKQNAYSAEIFLYGNSTHIYVDNHHHIDIALRGLIYCGKFYTLSSKHAVFRTFNSRVVLSIFLSGIKFMQHGVCRIDLCCLVYFSAIVKNQSLKKKKKIGFMILYVAWFCCYGQLRFLKFSLVKYHHSFGIQSRKFSSTRLGYQNSTPE